MKKKEFCASVSLLALFIVWTLLLCFVDVRAVGPQGTSVGFGALNGLVHKLIGVNMTLYTVTDWLGLVPILTAFGFGMLGLAQLIKRKSIIKVDCSILALGVFYIAVMGAYVIFEIVIINYRPILIDGYLETSYPSSTTMLVLCVMTTAIMQLKARIKSTVIKVIVICLIVTFIAFMVIGRLLSGVHWITDIIGGALLSLGLVTMYHSLFYLKSTTK